MFRLRCIFFTSLMVLSLLTSAPAFSQSKDEAAIRALIERYGKAMNASDVDAVVPLFSKDAVFMPSGGHTAVGSAAIRAAYEHEFKVIDLDVKIVFDEILQNGNMAAVRTRSKGSLKLLLKGNKVVPTDAYRAFFVLQKQEDKWLIARFMFNFNKK
ncbi:MAG: SgcJ/EcaC family oxidoreductase [Thiohalomonadales bacterium]